MAPKGWSQLRKEDSKFMWEHCVLNELQGPLQTHTIHYWRDKRGHEIDFVLCKRNSLTALECKFMGSQEDITSFGRNLTAFRHHYPEGDNFLVASTIDTSFQRPYKGLTITFVNPQKLIQMIILQQSHS